ncbi:MAG: phycobiliprotein lyase [Leptolyngbya sp.]|nr:phycobiliprotein lyase [Leptolyngbya sp.]
MDIVNFFESVEGTWFSQRTIHQVSTQQSQTGQTTLAITRLSPDAAPVKTLCEKFAADPTQTVMALEMRPEGGDPAVLVALHGDGSSGPFLSHTPDGGMTQGEYRLEDDVLTLVSEVQGMKAEERLWYLNPNLRMRTCLVDQPDGTQLAAFCSEIRRGVTRSAS